ncbi:MAG TPA: hypothetical protein VND64_36530 [Pirellulales bacterium]|nr:hypothetical protein [Pirellulales bacterium]
MGSKLKPKWVGAAIATLIMCAVAIWLPWLGGHRINMQIYGNLSVGMTHAQVEELLGDSGGTRDDFVVWLNNRSPVMGPGVDLVNEFRDQPGIRYWYQDSGIVVIRFDSDNRIADKLFLSVTESTLSQKLRRFFERYGW